MSKLLGKTRKQNAVEARQVGMFLSEKYTDRPLKIIGLKFGGRHHSTVIHALRTVERRKELNAKFDKSTQQLEDKICQIKGNKKIQKLEQRAKREAVKIHGILEQRTAELPESLYCFTKEELFEYKQALKNAENQ